MWQREWEDEEEEEKHEEGEEKEEEEGRLGGRRETAQFNLQEYYECEHEYEYE